MTEATKQFDATTRRLVDFAERSDYAELSADVVHEASRRLIDTLESALGAYGEPPARMASALASRTRGDDEVSVWGSDSRTTPEMAAFTNGTMTRLLDISDT